MTTPSLLSENSYTVRVHGWHSPRLVALHDDNIYFQVATCYPCPICDDRVKQLKAGAQRSGFDGHIDERTLNKMLFFVIQLPESKRKAVAASDLPFICVQYLSEIFRHKLQLLTNIAGQPMQLPMKATVYSTYKATSQEHELITTSVTSAARYIWLWRHQSQEWKKYSDVEIEIIENAFILKQRTIELDESIIDLKNMLQMNKFGKKHQTPIKRVEISGEHNVRERFLVAEPLTNTAFAQKQYINVFIYDWFCMHGWRGGDSWYGPSGEEIVEEAAQGIIVEGEKLDRIVEARWLAEKLRSVKSQSKLEIQKMSVKLYTFESFLYKRLNAALRNQETEAIITLGAFCYLIWSTLLPFGFEEKNFSGIVYRGMALDKSQIQSYMNAAGDQKWYSWLCFSSTSKNRLKAEQFGNTLFVINNETAREGVDISSVSAFPEEEEVLLQASLTFQVVKVIYDNVKKKYEVHLKIRRRGNACGDECGWECKCNISARYRANRCKVVDFGF